MTELVAAPRHQADLVALQHVRRPPDAVQLSVYWVPPGSTGTGRRFSTSSQIAG
ncbi:hypothetical protein PUR71_04175 [Streptomyces sp. SP17BM10]|uniref:hypothetical protein n=1 Tax=Streptomyces sp. SP17BM10 TaxID=3002530 RepID=UPI002E78473F|nr:hypothetical protein [Streptomyces sp. SP17BM10]MEE1782129.1 hypothetical protein [Streptomyces sp. SP17BM10]